MSRGGASACDYRPISRSAGSLPASPASRRRATRQPTIAIFGLLDEQHLVVAYEALRTITRRVISEAIVGDPKFRGGNLPIDQDTAIALLRTATTALTNAKTTAVGQHTQLGNEIEAADDAMREMTTAFTNVSNASPTQMADTTAAAARVAAAGLQTTSTLLNAAIPPQPHESKSLDEWKECRTTIDRCDKLLVDLRKTGFGFVTAVVALYSLLLFATCAIFWASIPLIAEDLFSAPRANIYGAFVIGLLVILASPFV
jgi:hypothetical protein